MKMKSWLTALTIFFVTLGIVGLPCRSKVLAAETVFTDIISDHPYFFAIKSLKERGLVNGYSDSTFRPDNAISRAEVLSLTLRFTFSSSLGPTDHLPEISFSDVSRDTWFYPYVKQGVALGLVRGYSDNTFRPLQNIRLQEGLTLAFAGFKIPVPQKSPEEPWYAPYFQIAREKNLFDPNAEGTLSPEKFLTRGEMVELLFRTEWSKVQGRPFDYTVEWNTFSHDANYFEVKYPVTWNIFKGSKNSVIWKPDSENNQVWMTRVTPLSARLSLSFVENDPSLSSARNWFSSVKQKQEALYGTRVENLTEKYITFREAALSGKAVLFVDIISKRFYDAYIFLAPGKGLILYGEYGNSGLSEFLKKMLDTMIRSYRYIEPKPPSPPPLSPEQKLQKTREAILIEGKGPEILAMLSDEVIIETDAIGVGTGPIDYYYSQEINATIKYERGSKTILNVQEGRTTQF